MVLFQRTSANQTFNSNTIKAENDRLSIGDRLQLMSTSQTAHDESEESWTIKDEAEEEDEEFYNMEFNVEPKMQSASSKQSSRLTKQSSHIDDLSSVEDVEEENEWKLYYDDDPIRPDATGDNFAKIIDYDDVSDHKSQNDHNLSDENFEDGESTNDENDMKIDRRELES